MFYFFEREQEFVRVEIDGDDRTGCHLTVTEPQGLERTERFATSAAAQARWVELQRGFK